jgi:hypothetical protein
VELWSCGVVESTGGGLRGFYCLIATSPFFFGTPHSVVFL